MKISVAAIQMESLNNDYEGNKKRAEKFINDAVNKGVHLILLPEFALAGYIYSDNLWKEAEPLRGRTFQWMCTLCDQHSIYIATCILEHGGKDFYDTFILCGPGNQLWFHRKIEPAGYEAFFFRGAGLNECVFETPIGKIGVAICFDTSKSYIIRNLISKQPDILLVPFSCPTMPNSFPQRFQENWIGAYYAAPAILAKSIQVPIVACNKTGPFLSPMPMGFGMQYRGNFIDRTSIVDKDGAILSTVDGNPGIAIAVVEIQSAGTTRGINVCGSRWFLPISLFTRFMSEITQKFGMLRYMISQKRRKAPFQDIDHV